MRRRTFVRAAGVGAVGGLAGCSAPTGNETTEEAGGGEATEGGGGGPTETAAGETTATQQGGQGGGTETVQMVTEGSEFYFDPIGLFVEPGTTVEWVIDSGTHSATAYAEGTGGAEVTRIPDDAEPWDSGTLSEQGASFDYTFEVEGTYDYFCIPHKTLGMIARVVCGEPGGVEGNPPDGEVPSAQAIVDQGSISYEEFSGGG